MPDTRTPVEPCDECIKSVERTHGPLRPGASQVEQGDRYRLWQAQHLLHTGEASEFIIREEATE